MKYLDDPLKLRAYIRAETGKCMFCGFCEALCPTLVLGPHRGYGPRGRINLARLIANGEVSYSTELAESVFSCLLCEACHLKCPGGIDIVGVVRATRALYAVLEGVSR